MTNIREWPGKVLGLLALISSLFGGQPRTPRPDDGYPEGVPFGMGEDVRHWIENQEGKAVGKERRLSTEKGTKNV